MRQFHRHLKIQNLIIFGHLAAVLANVHRQTDRQMDFARCRDVPELCTGRLIMIIILMWIVNWKYMMAIVKKIHSITVLAHVNHSLQIKDQHHKIRSTKEISVTSVSNVIRSLEHQQN